MGNDVTFSEGKRQGIEVDNCLLVSRLKVKLNYTLIPYLPVFDVLGHT